MIFERPYDMGYPDVSLVSGFAVRPRHGQEAQTEHYGAAGLVVRFIWRYRTKPRAYYALPDSEHEKCDASGCAGTDPAATRCASGHVRPQPVDHIGICWTKAQSAVDIVRQAAPRRPSHSCLDICQIACRISCSMVSAGLAAGGRIDWRNLISIRSGMNTPKFFSASDASR